MIITTRKAILIKSSDWLYLISTVTAIVSIFLSNYLGRITTRKNNQRDMKVARYRDFYVPIMAKLYKFNPQIFFKGGMAGNIAFTQVIDEPIDKEFQDIAGKTRQLSKNWLHEYIRSNLQYATPEVLEIYYSSFPIHFTSPKYSFSNSAEKNMYSAYEQRVYANNRDLTVQILKEASQISKEIQLPNIAEPLLKRIEN